jgi:flagellar motor switch/type III secretory pathway protein FliN
MNIDQDEINSLLAQAEGLAGEAAVLEEPPPPPPPPPRRPLGPVDPEVARILRLRVPVIVQLAERRMKIAAIRKLSVGSIIEFQSSVHDELSLVIRNQRIGRGACVKAGESFGLRLMSICAQAQRIRSLGAPPRQ